MLNLRTDFRWRHTLWMVQSRFMATAGFQSEHPHILQCIHIQMTVQKKTGNFSFTADSFQRIHIFPPFSSPHTLSLQYSITSDNDDNTRKYTCHTCISGTPLTLLFSQVWNPLVLGMHKPASVSTDFGISFLCFSPPLPVLYDMLLSEDHDAGLLQGACGSKIYFCVDGPLNLNQIS